MPLPHPNQLPTSIRSVSERLGEAFVCDGRQCIVWWITAAFKIRMWGASAFYLLLRLHSYWVALSSLHRTALPCLIVYCFVLSGCLGGLLFSEGGVEGVYLGVRGVGGGETVLGTYRKREDSEDSEFEANLAGPQNYKGVYV